MEQNRPASKPDLSKLHIDRSRRSGSEQLLFTTLRSRALLISTLIFVLMVLLTFAWWPKATSTAPSVTVEASQSTASSPIPETASAVLYATGYVVAQRQAAVASKATGRLIELRVVEGDSVTKDQVLAVLENTDLQAIVHERQASIGSLQARLRGAEAEARDAQTSYHRAQQLFAAKVISQAEFDSAQTRARRAEADRQALVSDIELASAQLERAKVELSYSYIVAPFDGTVLTKNADIGEIVAPYGSSTNARAAVVTIADMSSLQVEADVSESNLSKIHLGQSVEITLDSLPSKRYPGRVVKIVPTVDRAKATILTKIEFVERDDQVIPEMSAKISFLTGEPAVTP